MIDNDQPASYDSVDAKIDSGMPGNTTEIQGLVVQLGWMGSKLRQIAKYNSIYEKYGFKTLSYAPSIDMSTFNIVRLNFHCNRILSDINKFYLENSDKTVKLYIHVWSNGGGFQLAKMNQLLSKPSNAEKYKNIQYNGIIYDSCPGHTGSLKDLGRLTYGIYATMDTELSKVFLNDRCYAVMKIIGFIIKWIILFLFLIIIWPCLLLIGLFYAAVTCQLFSFFFDYFNVILWGGDKLRNEKLIRNVSSLHITSEIGTDFMCPNEHTFEIIKRKKKICENMNQAYIEGLPYASKNGSNQPILIQSHVFMNSKHVSHYKLYKTEYTTLVQQFIEYCNNLN